MGCLYIVATPIGNLEDVTLRALRVLSEVSLVAAEDTRTAAVFLGRYGLRPRTMSYTDHNMKQRIPAILRHLEKGDAALVSDAGTPAVSDPGVDLVAAARAAGHDVVAVPGPSAVIAALSVAGLRCSQFRFAGFLPKPAAELRALLEDAKFRPETLVAFEAPGRLRKTLTTIDEVFSQRRIAVCRELTKLHEETFVGRAADALAHFTAPRGEIVLLIEGSDERLAEFGEAAGQEVREMRRLGLSRAQAQALTEQRHGISRRRFYELWLEAEG